MVELFSFSFKISFYHRSVIIQIIILILFAGCDPADNRLLIVNNSESDIQINYSCHDSLSDFFLERNTDISYGNLEVEPVFFIKSKNEKRIIMRGFNAWYRYVSNCSHKELFIYVFNDSVVNSLDDNYILLNGLFYKESFSLKQLERSDWEIIIKNDLIFPIDSE